MAVREWCGEVCGYSQLAVCTQVEGVNHAQVKMLREGKSAPTAHLAPYCGGGERLELQMAVMQLEKGAVCGVTAEHANEPLKPSGATVLHRPF